MDFKFEIDEQILIAEALFGKKSGSLKNWESIKNTMWKKYKEAYELFSYKEIVLFFTKDNALEELEAIPKQTKALFSEVKKTEEYKKLLKETKEYKEWLQKEWANKKNKILKELKDILKTELPLETFRVVVLHPSLGNGINTGDKILWGHSEDWKNYSLVYLAHEALHSLFGKSSLEHALIELITDNELRVRLNQNESYYLREKELVGHENLFEIKKELLKSWNDYLENSDQNIFEFLKKIKKVIPSQSNNNLC